MQREDHDRAVLSRYEHCKRPVHREFGDAERESGPRRQDDPLNGGRVAFGVCDEISREKQLLNARGQSLCWPPATPSYLLWLRRHQQTGQKPNLFAWLCNALNVGPSSFWISELVRAYDLTIEQDRDLRRRILFDLFTPSAGSEAKRKGAYWYIPWQITRYAAPGLKLLEVHAAWPQRLADIPTRLMAFSTEMRYRLINWGYALTDAAVRRWYRPSTAEPHWPYPKYDLKVAPAN